MAGFSTCTKLSRYGEGMMIYKDGKELFLDKIECGMLSASIKQARKNSWDRYRLPKMVEQKYGRKE